jgi:hypothetical protein
MISKDNIAFDVVDEETVRRLWFDDPDLLPHLKVDKGADVAYNRSRINSIVLSGILRGQSVDGMAFTLANISKTNMSSAVRSVRTAVTSAENGGRLSRLQALEAAGVSGLGKQWLATGDERTRESHMAVNGEIVKPQERFSNGLLCPGDPDGAASEVYNCRCSMRTVLDGVNSESAAQYTEDAQAAFERWQENRFQSIGKASKKIKRYAVTDRTIASLPKISAPGWTEDQTERLLFAHKKLLRYAKKFPNKECAYTLRYPDMLLDEHIIVGDESVTIPDRKYPYIGIHNHPTNTTFTHSDLLRFVERENMMGLTAVGNNGTVYGAFKTVNYDKVGFSEFMTTVAKKLLRLVKNGDVESYLQEMNRVLEEAEKYGVYYDIGEN